MSRIRANQITNQSADGAPTVQNGLVISGVTTSTTFSGSGASLTNLPAAQLTGTLPAISGANLTNLDASDLASGTVPVARIGTGTKNTSTFYRGDGTFAVVNSDLVADTSPQLGGTLDAGTRNIFFGDGNGTNTGELRFGSGTDMRVFHDGSNTKFKNSAGRIHIENSAGPIRTQTDNGFYMMSNDGNTVHAEVDSDGLKFNGDTAAANALDDYEEGSYTANFEVTSGSANFHNNTLHYVKIGSTCYVHGEIGTNSKNNPGGDLRFDLPFTAKASGSNMDGHARGLVGAIWNYYGTSNPYGSYGWYPLHIQLNSGAANNVILYIVGYNSQNSNWGPIGNLIGSGAQIGISFTYRTA